MKINYENNVPIKSIIIRQPETCVVTNTYISLFPLNKNVIQISPRFGISIYVDIRRASELKDALILLIKQLEKD